MAESESNDDVLGEAISVTQYTLKAYRIVDMAGMVGKGLMNHSAFRGTDIGKLERELSEARGTLVKLAEWKRELKELISYV